MDAWLVQITGASSVGLTEYGPTAAPPVEDNVYGPGDRYGKPGLGDTMTPKPGLGDTMTPCAPRNANEFPATAFPPLGPLIFSVPPSMRVSDRCTDKVACVTSPRLIY